MREEILGFHNDCFVNLTALAQACTECVKVTTSAGCGSVVLLGGNRAKGGHGAQAKQGPAHGRDFPRGVYGLLDMNSL
jgi:hypothetical protein